MSIRPRALPSFDAAAEFDSGAGGGYLELFGLCFYLGFIFVGPDPDKFVYDRFTQVPQNFNAIMEPLIRMQVRSVSSALSACP
jgi:hypothetical protein